MATPASHAHRPPIINLLLTFLTLGIVSGSSSHSQIQVLRWVLVERRAWIDDMHFTELVNYAQHVPGPTSLQVIATLGAIWMGTYLGGVILLGIFLLPGCCLMYHTAKWIEVTGRNDFFSFNSQWFTEHGPLIPADWAADRLSQAFVGVVSVAPAAALVLAFVHARTQATDARRALFVLVSLLCCIILPAAFFPILLPSLLLLSAAASYYIRPVPSRSEDGKPSLPLISSSPSSSGYVTPLSTSSSSSSLFLSSPQYKPSLFIQAAITLAAAAASLPHLFARLPPVRRAIYVVKDWLAWAGDVAAAAAEAARQHRARREREAAKHSSEAGKRGEASSGPRSVLAESNSRSTDGSAEDEKENNSFLVQRSISEASIGVQPSDDVALLHHFLGSTDPLHHAAFGADSADVNSFTYLRSRITSPVWSALLLVSWAACLLFLVISRRTVNSDDGWMIISEMLYRASSFALGGDHLLFAPMQFEYLATNGTAHPPLVIIFALAAAQLLPGHVCLSAMFLAIYSIGDEGVKLSLVSVGLPLLFLTFALLPFYDQLQANQRGRTIGAAAEGASLAASGVELAGLFALIMPQLLSPGPLFTAAVTALAMVWLRLPLRLTAPAASLLGWLLYKGDLGGPYCWVPSYMQAHMAYAETCMARN